MIDEKLICYSPVGTIDERQSRVIWPGNWKDENPIGSFYFLGVHTGADLNWNEPGRFDLDAHTPVYAIADGYVEWAFNSGGSGNLIIINHNKVKRGDGVVVERLIDGGTLDSRYWHGEKVLVKQGEFVTAGQQICSVGNAGGNFPYHLHFDISNTGILRKDPTYWPGTAQTQTVRNLVFKHFLDPKIFLQSQHVIGELPARTFVEYVVVNRAGLNLRLQIGLNNTPKEVLRVGDKFLGSDLNQEKDGWLWGITPSGLYFSTRNASGSTIMSEPTVIAPIPDYPTPYDGKMFVWLWTGQSIVEKSVDEIAETIRKNAPQINGLIVKTNDGADWQGKFENSALEINGVEDVALWVERLKARGLEFHAWCTLQGLDIDAESERVISVCNTPGVRSMILDIEPHAGFWQGSRQAVIDIMESIRSEIPLDFHIGLSVDPRSQHYARIYPDAWYPYVQSVHPQVYWKTFGTTQKIALDNTYNTWQKFGKLIFPVLQGDSPPIEIGNAIIETRDNRKAKGFSFWRLGVIDKLQFAAIDDVSGDLIKPVFVDHWNITTDNVRVRDNAGLSGAFLRWLKPGEKISLEDLHTNLDGYEWGRTQDDNYVAIKSIDGFKVLLDTKPPVIVLPPIEAVKRDYWVVTPDGVKERINVGLGATQIGSYKYGAKVLIEEINAVSDGWLWGKTSKGFVALRRSDNSLKLFDTKPPVIVLPTGEINKMWLHVHEGHPDANYTMEWLRRFAREGLIGGLHFINHGAGILNEFAGYGIPILSRSQENRFDGQPRLTGTRSDIDIGVQHIRENGYNARDMAMLSRDIYIQPFGTCEQNAAHVDGYFNVGMQMAAWDKGYHLGLFTDSYGTPANQTAEYDSNGIVKRFLPHPAWTHRIESGCLKLAVELDNWHVYNGYGSARNGKETDDYGSALWEDGTDDKNGWIWHAHNHGQATNDLLPIGHRPKIVLGECGSSAATIARLGGRNVNGVEVAGKGWAEALIWDMNGYQRRIGNDPNYIGAAYWTLGGAMGYGFEYSTLDYPIHGVLPKLYEWLVSQKHRWVQPQTALRLAA